MIAGPSAQSNPRQTISSCPAAETPPAGRIDAFLASVLSGAGEPWPFELDAAAADRVAERAAGHGIALLLIERYHERRDWPEPVLARLMDHARSQTIWEMRHRIVLAELLARFADAEIGALLLKGTAIAYDLYPDPAARRRADTDLLIEPRDLRQARLVLASTGFTNISLPHWPRADLHLQETWRLDHADGTRHHIDLHWQVMNAPALASLLSHGECRARMAALPRLCDHAYTMDRASMLLHTCLHRAAHLLTPVYRGDEPCFGADRLIWLHDIGLLCAALDEPEWLRFCAAAERCGVATLCLEALTSVRTHLHTSVPEAVIERLAAAPTDSAAIRYLRRSGRLRRGWSNFAATPGAGRKFAYVAARALPSPAFLRAKYPDEAHGSLVRLYWRRLSGLLRSKRERAAH
jgi:hypothetical protein